MLKRCYSNINIENVSTFINDSKAVPLGVIHLALGRWAISFKSLTGKEVSVEDKNAVKAPVYDEVKITTYSHQVANKIRLQS